MGFGRLSDFVGCFIFVSFLAGVFVLLFQTVGMFPPSMTYSLPVIEAARAEARNAINSATSLGRFGRPSGIPPSECIRFFLAAVVSVPARAASRSINLVAASV